jgi:hypothetical protein
MLSGEVQCGSIAAQSCVRTQNPVVPLEFDHVFVCCSAGAPEGDALVRLGLTEGSPNTHPGQGTANRRFFFRNAFLELLWVAEPAEARSEQTRRTRLWERWFQRASGVCPFRATGADTTAAPFTTWAYRPIYLPPGVAIEFAEGVPLEEPELVYLPILRRSGPPAHEPIDHSLPIRQIRDLTIGLPSAANLSPASKAVLSAGLVSYRFAPDHVLELSFASSQGFTFDLRPTLPLVFRGVRDAA